MKATLFLPVFLAGMCFSPLPGKAREEGEAEDPTLVTLLRKFDAPNSEGKANMLRVELWAYWEKRMDKVYGKLLRHYSGRPELAGQLKTAQQAWSACRDATVEAYGQCLKQGSKERPENGWYAANMNCLFIDLVEERCRILEELLALVQGNDL